MNKPFTELPIPPKERMILTLYFTKAPADATDCEICHMSRVSFADTRPAPLACAVCGRLLCWSCYGHEGVYTGSDLKHYPICDTCGDLEREEINAILELRSKLNQP